MQISKEWIKADLIRTKQFVDPWYKPAPFHYEIANVLQDETIKNLVVTVPSQFGKTELLCKTFPPCFLADKLNKTIIVSSYNQEYVNKISVSCSDFFTNPRFQQLFNVKPHSELWNKRERLLQDYNGGMLFTGAGSGTTGNPADLFLLDDLTKDYEDASSKVKQETLWFWFNMVVDSRLQGDDSRVIIVMTRWLKNDLIGKIQKREEEKRIAQKDRFRIMHFGALYDKCTNKIASIDLLNEIASDETEKKYTKLYSLWPEKKSVHFLMLKFKKEPKVFETMYQGNPMDLEGNVINTAWITYVEDIKFLGEIKYSCRGWDFGFSESGDYTVGAKIDVYEVGEMIIPVLSDVVRFRKNPPETKEIVVNTGIKDGKNVIIGLESGGTQKTMASDIVNRKELFDYEVRTYIPKSDKVARAMGWIVRLADGVFKFVKASWNSVVVGSLASFGEKCDHDDIEDAITTAWKTLFGDPR